MVGGRGNYLDPRNELTGSVLNLIRTHEERLDSPFAGKPTHGEADVPAPQRP